MDREQFAVIATRHGLTATQATGLWTDLYGLAATTTPPTEDMSAAQLLSHPTQPFDQQNDLSRLVQVGIWGGIVLICGAVGWWGVVDYDQLGQGGVLAMLLVLISGFLVGAEFARRRGFRSLCGGAAGVIVFAVPPVVYLVERLLGIEVERGYSDFYPWISGGWIWMEIAAIVVGFFLLHRFRHPFLLFPLSLFAAFFAMDFAAALSGEDPFSSSDSISLVSVGLVGLVLAASGILLDYRGYRRFAFWPHLVGLQLLLGIALRLLEFEHSWGLFIVGFIAVGIGIWLARKLHLVLGALIIWTAISINAIDALPIMLLLGGLGMIGFALALVLRDSPLRRWLANRSLPARQIDQHF